MSFPIQFLFLDHSGRQKYGLDCFCQLPNAAQQLARQDATELVQRFGQVGVRKFNFAA